MKPRLELIPRFINSRVFLSNSRYNALHVAAKSDQSAMIKLVLSTLRDKNFYALMYPSQKDVQESSKDSFIDHIIDLYCNTPEKILFETPLHLACKFGFVGILKILPPYLSF